MGRGFADGRRFWTKPRPSVRRRRTYTRRTYRRGVQRVRVQSRRAAAYARFARAPGFDPRNHYFKHRAEMGPYVHMAPESVVKRARVDQ